MKRWRHDENKGLLTNGLRSEPSLVIDSLLKVYDSEGLLLLDNLGWSG